MRDVADRTVLVTGATDGLGRGLAEALAARGATVLVHGRSEERGERAVDEIRDATGNAEVHWLRADLASLQQTRRLAAEVADRADRLDALVSNAGIGTQEPLGGRRESEDGHELRFAVNYLAGYQLIRDLLPLLTASSPSRIVSVSSAGQQAIDFDDVMLERGYSGVRAYCQSKLAQIMMTFDLAEELDGTGVTATALHPATYMPTKIVPGSARSTLEEGVEATLRLVVDPDLEGVTGEYFNGRQRAQADAQASDPEARRRLRELTDRLTS